MLKKIKKKTYLIITIILILVVLILLFYNKDKITILGDRLKMIINANTQEGTVIDYKITETNDENMKVVFTIKDDTGIQKIVEDDFEIYPNGKTQVVINRVIEREQIHQFKVTTIGNNEEQLFTFIATTNPNLQIVNKDVLGDGTTKKIKIKYPDNENINTYYSIGDNESWQEYTGEMDVLKDNLEDFWMKIEWHEGKTINRPKNSWQEIFVTHNEEEALRKINIEYKGARVEESIKYYKIGEYRDWQEYTGEIDLLDSQIDLVDLRGVIEGENKLVIYAKQVIGGEIISESQYEEIITHAVKLDVFNYMRKTGKTLAEYGFTEKNVNNDARVFQIGNFTAGHSKQVATWSGTFTYNNPITYGATHLYVDFYQFATRRQKTSSTCATKLTAVYEDGTSTYKQNPTLTGSTYDGSWVHYPTEIELSDKNISYIQFYLNGIDRDYSSSQARLTSIIFKGIQIPVTEE